MPRLARQQFHPAISHNAGLSVPCVSDRIDPCCRASKSRSHFPIQRRAVPDQNEPATRRRQFFPPPNLATADCPSEHFARQKPPEILASYSGCAGEQALQPNVQKEHPGAGMLPVLSCERPPAIP